MKRGTIIPVLGILLIGLVSAINLNYGGYFDDTSIALGALFVLFFAVINFILGRTAFGNNPATRTIMALAISLLAVYGISNTNFSVSGGYFGHWYIGDYLPTILTIILIAGVIYLLHKFRLPRVLVGTGLILMILSQTNLIYEKNSVLVVGIILTIIGIFLLLKYKKPDEETRIKKHKERINLSIRTQGNGFTNPKEGMYNPKKNKKIRIEASPYSNSSFSHWLINGTKFRSSSIRLKMNKDYDCVAVFGNGKKYNGGGGKSRRASVPWRKLEGKIIRYKSAMLEAYKRERDSGKTHNQALKRVRRLKDRMKRELLRLVPDERKADFKKWFDRIYQDINLKGKWYK